MEPVVQLLCELIAIPSMNPMGRNRSGQEYNEENIARYVADYLRASGINARLDEVAPHRPNVLGYLDAGAAQTILLEAHLDTVFADNMAISPFCPELRDGKIYGRGACDTKASLAVFLHVMRMLAQRATKPRFNVLFLAVADEEYRFTGALHAAGQGLRAHGGIVGEPTSRRIVRAHKGVTRWRIVTHGKAAHSAYPDRGDNAIYTMGHILLRLEDYALGLQQDPPHPLLGTPTLSVGVIEGGQTVNIVPDRCTIEVDRRTLPGETTEGVLDAVRHVLKEVPDWSFDAPHLSVAGMEVPPSAKIMTMLSDAIRANTGDCKVETAQYATDAGIYNAAGIPCVVFGPGDIAQAHTDAEYVEVSELLSATAILETMLG